MKKSLLLIPALILLLAGTTACNQNGTASATAEGAEAGGPVAKVDVVYVRMDSVMANYAMFKELGAAFEEKSGKAETDLANRGRSLERDVMSAQERVQKGLVTTRQAQELEAELGRKNQNFMTYRDRLVGELAEEEQVMMNRISNSILEYMAEFNRDNRYGMIISTTAAGPVLHADPALDITAQVIEGLNAYYEANRERL